MTTDFGITSLDTSNRSPETKREALPISAQLTTQVSREILDQLNLNVGKHSLDAILQDPRFKELSIHHKKILLLRINKDLPPYQRLCDMLPDDLDPELRDLVDGWSLPTNQPLLNLEGKHLVQRYLLLTADLTPNQKRLYAHKLIQHNAFQNLLPEEQRAVLANLKLSPEHYAQLKEALPKTIQLQVGPLIDDLMGNSQAVVPYGQTSVQIQPRKSMTQENWVKKLQKNPKVLTGTRTLSVTGTKEELITLRDARAIVRVFPGQSFLISGYTITPEALKYIQTNAHKIEFISMCLEDRAANNNGTILLERDLDNKWRKAANVVYQAKNEQSATSHQLPLIDVEDARAIVDGKIHTPIRGYAITYDALQYFKENDVDIDLHSNLIVSDLLHSDSDKRQPKNWAEIIKNNTTIRASNTVFDELKGLESLKQVLEPANTQMVFARTNEIIDLDSAESLASAVNNNEKMKSQTIKLIGYTLTTDAAEYLKKNAVTIDISNSAISPSRDPSFARNESLLNKWNREVSKTSRIVNDSFINIVWTRDFTPSGWELTGDSDEIITLNNAKALVQAVQDRKLEIPIKLTALPIKLTNYWLTKQAAEYLKGFPIVKFEKNWIAEHTDPGVKKTQELTQKWTQALIGAIPVSQFRTDAAGPFPVIDTTVEQNLRQTCQTLDISKQIQISGYAITEDAFLGLVKYFPKMKLDVEKNVIVTNKLPETSVFPNFGNLLVSSATLDGNLARIAGQDKNPIIDDENVEALIAALQQQYPNQRVIMPGYTITEDIKKRLEGFVDLRFCCTISAAPKISSPHELALVPVGSREIAQTEKSGALETKRELSPIQRERNWTLKLQKNTDVMTGRYLVLPFSKQDKVIEIEDAKTILKVCEEVTGPISAIRGHTITREAYNYLSTKAPHIDLRLNRIAPQANTLVICEKIGKTLATVLCAVIVVAAIAGVFMLIGEVAFIILAFASLGAFLVLIGKVALGLTTPLRWTVEMLPTWLYMLELYARSLDPAKNLFKNPMQEPIEEIARPTRSWLSQKFHSLWTSETPNDQALVLS